MVSPVLEYVNIRKSKIQTCIYGAQKRERSGLRIRYMNYGQAISYVCTLKISLGKDICIKGG